MARRFKPSEVVDFVVVGSGAAGGVMARELSQVGFTVVVQALAFRAADHVGQTAKRNEI
jgi:choline dehydrogenase-like flavoprotein